MSNAFGDPLGPFLGQSRCQRCGSYAVSERREADPGDPFVFACKESSCGREVSGPTYEQAHRNFNRPLMTPEELDAESLRHAGLVVAAAREAAR